MTKRLLIPTAAIAFGVLVATALAGPPFPGTSTCTVTVTQFPIRPACMSNWEPDVVRLTPAGSAAVPLFDLVSVTVRVRNANYQVIPNAVVSFSEQEPALELNISNGGSTTALTDSEGLATISLSGAAGFGLVALCADGVPLCALQVRSPDIGKSGGPAGCGLGTVSSSVSGFDINDPACGFLVHFGPVVVGDNDGFDLNCDWSVNGADITGSLGKGGVLQYFGDTGTLGDQNPCLMP